ncbi:MAG: deoxyribonuclease IV [Candidatus Acididesulfobacter guangdongensis]|uniref:Probable endonuclease 4 n=1 Tax=Acididesulfobacter guangdongensis TaxID=2597225 RepID=A0A519BFK2_ACIG2|nr:MAG: deoxyribonuclease IV [Candidatus Acididesulfobacter guangdongensis]
MLIGAHVSIAGGLENSCVHAVQTGSNAIQIFTKNQVRWDFKDLKEDVAANFKNCINKLEITPISHISYLINLGSTDENVERKSYNLFIEEIKRCHILGINQLIFHPGSNKNLTEDETVKKISFNLKKIIEETNALYGGDVSLTIETTAGQGAAIGYKLEHIRDMIGIIDSDRMKVCIDTCHIFAAGYDIRSEDGYNNFMETFSRLIGLNRLSAFHLNDSMKDLSSKIDRHAGIGKGFIGTDTFKFIINDKRFDNTPMVVETPGNDSEHKQDIDIIKSLRIL